MDRKSILGFIMIALVIILYPWYMNIVAPIDKTTPLDNYEDQIISDNKKDQINKTASPINTNDNTSKNIVVESPYYNIIINNKNGGSFVKYQLLEYSRYDSALVNMIDPQSTDNLTINFISMDGENISLNNYWQSINNKTKVTVGSREETLEFQTTFNGKKIKKIFTFYPDSYKIGLNVLFDDPTEIISRGQFSLSWNGGLLPTEKNKKTDYQEFRAYAYLGDELLGSRLKKDKLNQESQTGSTKWAAIRTKYFITSFIPNMPGIGAKISGKYIGDRPAYNMEIFHSLMNDSYFNLYIGPLDYNKIKSLNVGLENAMSLGWKFIRPIGRLITWTLKSMYAFIPNYGMVVILFAILIKILLNPLTVRQFKSTKKMQEIQPKLQKIKEKYKNDTQKLSKAQMQLFKDSGYNPASSCLPLFLQMPILFAVFTVFRTTIDFRGAPFFGWITDLSVPDTLFSIGGLPINILPFFMGATMFLQQKMMSPNSSDPQQKTMMYAMNGVFLILFYTFPSGLNLYYSVFNLLSIAQQKYMGVGKVNLNSN